MQFPIRCKRQATYILPMTTTSARVKYGETGSTGPRQLRIVNDSAATAFLAFGDDNTTVAVIPVAGTLTSGTYGSPTPGTKPILAGGVEIFTTNGLWVAGILGSGTGNLYVTECDGF